MGEELVVVVEGIYQYVGNTSEGNSLLGEMANILQQTSVPCATGLTLEINTWLDAREAASRQDYPLAIRLYTRALEYSKNRNIVGIPLTNDLRVAEYYFTYGLALARNNQCGEALQIAQQIQATVPADENAIVALNEIVNICQQNLNLTLTPPSP